MKRFMILSALVFSALVVVGCGNTSTDKPTPSSIATSSDTYNDYSLNIDVQDRRGKITSSSITSITMDVQGTSILYVSGLGFTKVGSSWTITLPTLPIDENLTFSVKAYQGTIYANTLVYTATKVQSLVNGENNVTLDLTKSSSEYTYLKSIQSTQIALNTDGSKYLRFNFTNTGTNYYNYTIQSNDINFSQTSGYIYIGYNSFLDINYTEPTVAGTYRSTFTLTDDNNNTSINSFDIIISNSTNSTSSSTTNVVLNMAPDINSIVANFVDNNTTILTADVSDPEGDAINYKWTIYSYSNIVIENNSSTTNPLYLSGDVKASNYTNATLTVTDSGGSSSSIQYILK